MPKTCIPRARLIDGNSHRFYALFVGFPTCGRLDVSVQRGLCTLVTRRMFGGRS